MCSCLFHFNSFRPHPKKSEVRIFEDPHAPISVTCILMLGGGEERGFKPKNLFQTITKKMRWQNVDMRRLELSISTMLSDQPNN